MVYKIFLKSSVKMRKLIKITKNSMAGRIFFNLSVGLLIMITLIFFLPGCSFKGTANPAENTISDAGNAEDADSKSGVPEGGAITDNPGENTGENNSSGKTGSEIKPEDTDNGGSGTKNTESTDTVKETEPGKSQSTTVDGSISSTDETAAQSDPASSEGLDIKITLKAPQVSLQVMSGPEYAQENQVCFYRVKANINGEPFPQIKFNKDDSNSAWGLNVAQVNLTPGQSFTLVCEAVNSQGSAAAEINLAWVDNPNASREEGSTEQTAPEIVVDYTDIANFLIDVNLTAQQVTVLYKNVAIKTMACSGGKPETPTPQGTYTTNQKIYYAWIPKFAMGAYYWTRFYGPYLFHSVPYDSAGNMLIEELNKIGSPVSHGCIRLVLEDAKWLYETFPLGIKINIHG